MVVGLVLWGKVKSSFMAQKGRNLPLLIDAPIFYVVVDWGPAMHRGRDETIDSFQAEVSASSHLLLL